MSRAAAAMDSRSWVEKWAVEASGFVSTNEAACSSQRSIVPREASVRPAAREARSSGGLPWLFAARMSRAPSTAESATPAQVTAVRIASRPKYGSRTSSPGSPSTASTGAPSKTTRWLSEERIPDALNHSSSTLTPSERSTYASSGGQGGSPAGARTATSAVYSGGAATKGLDALKSVAALRFDQSGRCSLPGYGVGTPHPEAQAPGSDGRKVSGAQWLGGQHRNTLHAVEVAVEDPADRTVSPRDGAQHPPLLGEGCAAPEPGAGLRRRHSKDSCRRECSERTFGKGWVRVAFGGAGGDLGEDELDDRRRPRLDRVTDPLVCSQRFVCLHPAESLV